MDITQLSGVSSDYLNTFAKKEALVPGDDDSFSAVLSTAMKSVDETNDLQNTCGVGRSTVRTWGSRKST